MGCKRRAFGGRTIGRMTDRQPPDAAALWPIYAQHAALYMAGGPAPTFYLADRAFFATTGAPHVDLNQGALFGAATEEDASEVVDRILALGLPVLFGCSSSVSEGVPPVLVAAGFQPMPSQEHLFWAPGAPSLPELRSSFAVRRVDTDDDVIAMQAIFAEAHGYPPELTVAMFGRTLRTDDSVTGWIAWDGAEPVSFVIVTRAANALSMWDVMTPARHRRRGAARAVVGTSLAAMGEAAAAAGLPIEQTLFWSSPLGQPLYESMGFQVADRVNAWALGASEADLAAVGVSLR